MVSKIRLHLFLLFVLVCILFLLYQFSPKLQVIYLKQLLNTTKTVKEAPKMKSIQPFSWDKPEINQSDAMICKKERNLKPNVDICAHNSLKTKDFASAFVLRNELYEKWNVHEILKFSQKYPNGTLVDIGMNIGYHSLYAAALGLSVVGAEPNPQNYPNIQKSVSINHFQKQITLMPYAISDERKKVNMTILHNNIAITYVFKDKLDSLVSGPKQKITIEAVLLEDLLPFIKSKTIILKVDVESYECHVFRRARKFFKELVVPVVITEMANAKLEEPQCVKDMVNLMRELGYKVKNLVLPSVHAPANEYIAIKWPLIAGFDIIWRLE